MLYDDAQLTLLMDWDRSGWCRFLPFEGRVLWDVFCDATTFDIDGDVEALVDWHLRTKYPPMTLDVAGLLDAPLQYRRGWAAQRRLERLFAKAGHCYPRTARDIVDVGVALGLYQCYKRGSVIRWRAPAALPLPAEVLPMTPRQRAREDAHRWDVAAGYPAARIAELLLEDGASAETVTSISHLATCLEEDTESIRQGLIYLCAPAFERPWRRPTMRMLAGGPGGRLGRASPERLEDDAPCVLVPHWRRLWREHGLAWEDDGYTR